MTVRQAQLTMLISMGALLLSGCAGTPVPGPTVTVTVTATPEAEPEATATPKADPPHKLAEVVTHSGDWTVTLHQVVLDSATGGPQPENSTDKWASIEVENCNGTEPEAYITGMPWRLVASDNRQFQESSTGYSSFPEPSYAFGDTAIAAGECIRGWITFVVARDAVITGVKYSPSLGVPVLWPIG
ncbi:MAG: hypothetical protein ABWY54_04355 [Glaciihabitans sp.]